MASLSLLRKAALASHSRHERSCRRSSQERAEQGKRIGHCVRTESVECSRRKIPAARDRRDCCWDLGLLCLPTCLSVKGAAREEEREREDAIPLRCPRSPCSCRVSRLSTLLCSAVVGDTEHRLRCCLPCNQAFTRCTSSAGAECRATANWMGSQDVSHDGFASFGQDDEGRRQ